jgi:hypothetical protein
MAGTPFAPFAGPSYYLADRKAAVQRSVNCYPQRLEGDTWMLASTPGEVLIADLGAEVRGSFVAKGRWFVAAGNKLHEFYANGSHVERGTLSTSTGFVGMACNANQVAIVDGPNLYIYKLDNNTLNPITSAGWRGSDDVHELDGYFIFVDPDTDQFYISAIDDGTSLDALDFSSADSNPDNIVTHRVSHRQLWVFGELSTEIWIDSGDLAFPFVRYNSYTIDIGCMGKRAAIKAADTLFWLGQSERGGGIIYMASGNQPQRVSTTAVEQSLLKSSDLSKASMWTYQIEGHEFIAINAPGVECTWVYDAATQLWCERGEWLEGWQPLRSGLVTAFAGGHYAGDSLGLVVRLDDATDNLAGRPLVRERTWPHMKQPNAEPIAYQGLELLLKTGDGSGQVSLEISNDGGFTFGPPLLRALGAVGRYMQRVRWVGLGASFNRVFRIRCSDDVPFAIHSATVDAK